MRGAGRQEVAQRVRARGDHAPLASWREVGVTGAASQLGRPAGLGQLGRQVSPGKGFPFFVFFSISDICF